MNGTREEVLFTLALEQPADRRGAFLDAVCAGDAALRRRVEALLAAHQDPDPRLAEPAANLLPRPQVDLPTVESRPTEAAGQKIGRYKLLEKIGEGGFGEVWMTEQREPIKRRVALKLIKPGMDSRQIVARFQ